MKYLFPFGYTKEGVAKNGWNIDINAAVIVRRIFDMYIEGMRPYSIAGELNDGDRLYSKEKIWTASSVYKVLKNRAYAGELITGKTKNNLLSNPKAQPKEKDKWIVHKGHHPTIIDNFLFERVRLKMLEHKKASPNQDFLYDDFFCGKVFCGLCGRKMKRKTYDGKTKPFFDSELLY